MFAAEGLRRLQIVARCLCLLGIGLALITLTVMFIQPELLRPVPLFAGVFGINLFLLGVILWVGTWIAKGFLSGSK